MVTMSILYQLQLPESVSVVKGGDGRQLVVSGRFAEASPPNILAVELHGPVMQLLLIFHTDVNQRAVAPFLSLAGILEHPLGNGVSGLNRLLRSRQVFADENI